MFKHFIILVALVFIASPAFAVGSVKKGGQLPAIKLYDQHGGERQFGDLVGKNGMVLVFFRSADWCPYCKAQLIDLRNNKKKFDTEGYNIVGVSYDSIDKLMKFEKEHEPGFALLSDPASKTIRDFGLFNNDFAKGTFAYGVPHPAVYVVGKDKKVHAVLSEASYKERPQVKSILAEIEALKPKPKVHVGEEFPEDPTVDPDSIEVMEDVTVAPEEMPMAEPVQPEPEAEPAKESVMEPVVEPMTESGAEPEPMAPEPATNMPEAEKTE